MLYTKEQIFNKLNSLVQYSKLNHSLTSGTHYNFSESMDHVNSEFQAFISSKYFGKSKDSISKLFLELQKAWFWFSDMRNQKCENDDYLGIQAPTYQNRYWFDKWEKLTTYGIFDFSTIMNISNVDFAKAWVFEVDTNTQATTLYNTYIGKDDKHGWKSLIAPKRDQEIENIKNEINYLEISAFEVDDVIDMYEDRGDVIGTAPTITFTENKKKKVILRTIDGDFEQFIDEPSVTLNVSSLTIEQQAKMIYLHEYYGLFDIIKCLELYDIKDFSENSKPCSTYGTGKVYIPSFLKDEFKKFLAS